ncbi:putative SGNH hydrolase superfamily [Helianthus annuus]|nr:putative SGNH hydrolase superfamily [Helianthus annuus]
MDCAQAGVLRMSVQLAYFREYQERISGLIGASQAKELVNKALVLVSVGGNDFVNNYYLTPFSARRRQFALPNYVTLLISEYRKIMMVRFNHLKSFYLSCSPKSYTNCEAIHVFTSLYVYLSLGYSSLYLSLTTSEYNTCEYGGYNYSLQGTLFIKP